MQLSRLKNNKPLIIAGIIILAIVGYLLFDKAGTLLGALLAPLLGGTDKKDEIEASKVKSEEADHRQEAHEQSAQDAIDQAGKIQDERTEPQKKPELQDDDEFIESSSNSSRSI